MANLFDYIAAGDISGLRQLKIAGADMNALSTDSHAWTPLHAAIDAIDLGQDPALLTFLLDAGAEANRWDGAKACTPLLMAVFRGLHECVQKLIEWGAKADVRGSEGDTPLSWAVEKSDLEMLRILLVAGCRGTLNASAGMACMTPLGAAVHASWVPGITALIAAGASPHALDLDGRSAIYWARTVALRDLLVSPKREGRGKPVDRPSATTVAEGHIGASTEKDVAIMPEHTIERAWGWVFFFQSTKFIETGDIAYALAGNAPIFVNRSNGEVWPRSRTYDGVERQIEEYELELRFGVPPAVRAIGTSREVPLALLTRFLRDHRSITLITAKRLAHELIGGSTVVFDTPDVYAARALALDLEAIGVVVG